MKEKFNRYNSSGSRNDFNNKKRYVAKHKPHKSGWKPHAPPDKSKSRHTVSDNDTSNKSWKRQEPVSKIMPVKQENIQLKSIQEPFNSLLINYKSKSTPHVSSESDWVSQLLPEQKTQEKPIPLGVRKKLKEFAEKIYQDDVKAFKIIKGKHSYGKSSHFHDAILTHGTTKDKIAAHTLQCMESPLYSLNSLFLLLDFVDDRFKNNLQEAIDNVATLFKTTLLPEKHKAREFECHNFSVLIPLLKTNPEQVEKQLVLWYFENQLYLAYLKLIDNFEKVGHNSLHKIKSRGIKGLHNLVLAHPNQDPEIILQKLVNKLGDSNKRVTGEILNSLTYIQISCPQLKHIMVSLTEELLYRANVSPKAQYYGLCFLKDIILRKEEENLAEKLIKVYFDFFKMCSNSGEVNSRFMGALLRGLNRAYPYLEGKPLPFLEDKMSTLFKLAHLVGFNLYTQVLQLIYQVESSVESATSDRFYSLIYGKLLDSDLGNCSGSGAFLNIVFKSMAKDTNVARVCAFARRLLQVCKYFPSQLAVGTLYLVSEAIIDNPNIASIYALLMRKETKPKPRLILDDDGDDDLEYYPDLDTDDEADTKEEMPSSASMKTPLPKEPVESEEETDFSDLDVKPKLNPLSNIKIKTEASWFHRENWEPFKDTEVHTSKYDPMKRNPMFSGADLSPIWELQELKRHFHPTVSLFASNLLSQAHIEYSGDPLEDFTLTRFLDRFTHRNPKKIHGKQKISTAVLGNNKAYKPKGTRNIAVESEAFRNLRKDRVATEDLFFYNYFTKYRKREENIKKRKDDESVDDEEFDEYVSRMKDVRNVVYDDDDDYEAMDFAANVAPPGDDESEIDEVEEEGDSDGSGMEEDDASFEEDIDATLKRDDIKEDNEESYRLSDEDNSFEDEFSGDEDEFEEPVIKKKAGRTKWKSSSDSDWRGMLADADEFSQLLEGNAEFDDPFAGTSEAVSTKDRKTHRKQLLWEQKRQSSVKPKDDFRRPPAKDFRRPPAKDFRRPPAKDFRRPPAKDFRRPPAKEKKNFQNPKFKAKDKFKKRK